MCRAFIFKDAFCPLFDWRSLLVGFSARNLGFEFCSDMVGLSWLPWSMGTERNFGLNVWFVQLQTVANRICRLTQLNKRDRNRYYLRSTKMDVFLDFIYYSWFWGQIDRVTTSTFMAFVDNQPCTTYIKPQSNSMTSETWSEDEIGT